MSSAYVVHCFADGQNLRGTTYGLSRTPASVDNVLKTIDGVEHVFPLKFGRLVRDLAIPLTDRPDRV